MGPPTRPRRRARDASIRAEYTSDSDSDQYIHPGPGQYLKEHHTTTFGKQAIIHDHPQQFGSVSTRFKEAYDRKRPNLGPG